MPLELRNSVINLASDSYFSDAWWFLYKFSQFMEICVNFGVPHIRVFGCLTLKIDNYAATRRQNWGAVERRLHSNSRQTDQRRGWLCI